MIELKDLKHGYLYKLQSRNLSYGVFNSNNNSFVGIRQKFYSKFLDVEYEYTDIHFGTASVLEEVIKCPVVDLCTHLGSRCDTCGHKCAYVDWTKENRPEFNKFPGRWVHLENTECPKVDPVSINNDELYKWLEGVTLDGHE